MNTVQIAIEAKKMLESQGSESWEVDHDNTDTEYRTVWLGTYMAFDPCGKYHHMLSPNGVTQRCIDFWESLERQVEKRGMSMGAPFDTDGTDVHVSEYRDREDETDLEDEYENSVTSCYWCGSPTLGPHYCNDDCREMDSIPGEDFPDKPSHDEVWQPWLAAYRMREEETDDEAAKKGEKDDR